MTKETKLKKPNPFTRFLWWTAGADQDILMRATHSDRVKYLTLGGIILATGFMAALAGGYAFYTIFSPKNIAMDTYVDVTGSTSKGIKETIDFGSAMMSVVFGLIWGLVIFNIDRFIVTSTGTGDGTEKITWDEFKSAIPRLVMGAIIAITISKPVEIRMFKSEIDQKLAQIQLDEMEVSKIKVEALFDAKIIKAEQKISASIGRITTLRGQADKLQDFINYEIGNGGCKGKCEEYKRQKVNIQTQIIEEKNATEYLDVQKELKEIIVERDKQINVEKNKAAALDGLLERIKLAHEIAGWGITLFITLLFLAIELTPIFFKLMLIKSPYDYLVENQKELVKANDGIHIEYNYYPPEDENGEIREGTERHLVRLLEKERINLEKLELIESQKRLTRYALQKFEEQQMKLIDDNPEQYIKVSNTAISDEKEA